MKTEQQVAGTLSAGLGLGITATASTEPAGRVFILRLVDLRPPNGFAVRVTLGWRSVEVHLELDSFSSQVLATLGRATPEERKACTACLDAMRTGGASVDLKVNGLQLDTSSSVDWPGTWGSVALSVRRAPLETGGEQETALVAMWGGQFLAAVLALLGGEEVSGEVEGGAQRVEVNRYERSRLNRMACIAAHGCKCAVCGLVFLDTYGDIGAGFIEVHHREPVSELAPGTIIDPVKDLVPVCANCHAMLHRSKPPLAPEVLRGMLRRSQ